MTPPPRPTLTDRFLNTVERLGNRLPDPAALFVVALAVTWILSFFLSGVTFTDIDPRTNKNLVVANQLTVAAMVKFLSGMVTTFVSFPPLGVVLVAMLGVGVAERAGLVDAGVKALLRLTPRLLLTPAVLLVAIVSHSAGDTGFVLVIPLGGVIFAAAGRNPLAGVIAAFAGVSGGFSANLLPSSLDPVLQGFTQEAARVIDPAYTVNPLCNLAFTAASSVFIIFAGWVITDAYIEPRLRSTPIDGDPADMPRPEALSRREVVGLWASVAVVALMAAVVAWLCVPEDSPLRSAKGSLTAHDSPLTAMIVPLIFLAFFAPGLTFGYVAGTISSHRDVVQGMKKSMDAMGYYLVMAFCASLFGAAFRDSNLGALLALKGATTLQWLDLPPSVTIIGVVLLTAGVNLLIASASAKWALLAPILVPMLMRVGISPELTQAAYRIGDSSTNIVTPLMAYFPLIVVYCRRYAKGTGVGTLVSLMLPYCVVFLVCWTLLLIAYTAAGLPLGVG